MDYRVSRIERAFQILGVAIGLGIASSGFGQVSPPQGYIGIQRNFVAPSPTFGPTKRGFFQLDYPFRLENTSDDLAGTFWSNNVSFLDSVVDSLPANHLQVGKDAGGGYIGIQVVNSTDSQVRFSIWWATHAVAGPGAYCENKIEAWYHDDDPFNPPITSMEQVDLSRPLAGGRFRSCVLPISLQANQGYRLRVTRNATIPGEESWAASLINDDTGREQLIGNIQTPSSWGWLSLEAGGFVEHFGAMPNGCVSIPASSSTYYAVEANNGSVTSSISASLYGACETNIRKRSTINCGARECRVTVHDSVNNLERPSPITIENAN